MLDVGCLWVTEVRKTSPAARCGGDQAEGRAAVTQRSADGGASTFPELGRAHHSLDVALIPKHKCSMCVLHIFFVLLILLLYISSECISSHMYC